MTAHPMFYRCCNLELKQYGGLSYFLLTSYIYAFMKPFKKPSNIQLLSTCRDNRYVSS